MALIKNGRVTVILGILINMIFMGVKFFAFLYSHLNLFFADTIDSFVDCFVIFMIVVFLRFNLSNKLTYLSMDIMFFSQWCVIIVFRLIIILDQISDLMKPEPREQPVLTIIVSSIVVGGGIILAILFVDEDDVVKFFISKEEKEAKKKQMAQHNLLNKKKKKGMKILPIFAEALDNLVTTVMALVIGILLYFEIIVDYLYLIDDISNICISIVMFILAARELWRLSDKYKDKSFYQHPVVESEESPLTAHQ